MLQVMAHYRLFLFVGGSPPKTARVGLDELPRPGETVIRAKGRDWLVIGQHRSDAGDIEPAAFDCGMVRT